MRRPEPTVEELRRAWHHCRRATWPATFEEAMADALLSRLLRLNALHPPRSQRKPVETPRQQRGVEPAAHRRAQHCLPGMPPGLDRKRAAAGERDDD